MKTMMKIGLVLMLAMATEAAQVSWVVSNINTPTLNGSIYENSGSDFAGAWGLAFVGSTAPSSADVKTVLQKDTGWEALGFSLSDSKSSNGPSTGVGLLAMVSFGSYGSGDIVSVYAVIFDKEYTGEEGSNGYFMITPVIQQTFGGTGNKTYTFALANTAVWNQYTVVPEPTSMALLALGVAAVGLRRRFRK